MKKKWICSYKLMLLVKKRGDDDNEAKHLANTAVEIFNSRFSKNKYEENKRTVLTIYIQPSDEINKQKDFDNPKQYVLLPIVLQDVVSYIDVTEKLNLKGVHEKYHSFIEHYEIKTMIFMKDGRICFSYSEWEFLDDMCNDHDIPLIEYMCYSQFEDEEEIEKLFEKHNKYRRKFRK